MVSHGSFTTAVQLQPLPALTVTVPVAAAAVARFVDDGVMVKVQGAPAWFTVNVVPAIDSVPVREPAPVFAPTL